ncbi:MAG: ATP-binding cassette domain-containing protein [Rhodothermales bacterium]
MIQLSHIDLAFGGQPILDDLTWTITKDKRIGLIGPNGAGKSTLLKIISGSMEPDGGTISYGGLSVGYLEQDFQEIGTDRSVLDETLKAFDEILALHAREEQITEELGRRSDYESDAYHKLLHDLEEIHNVLVNHDAHFMKPRAESVLAGLGFETSDLSRPLNTFSGGWRMRVALAKLLLRKPDVLLLDEPTNHLDIDSIGWLEGYLNTYPGTVVIVSHDRYFLDRMTTTTAELYAGRVTEFKGNYSFYLEARVTQRELYKASYENQQREIEQAERFIERFRSKATKARQVQSRVKALDKMERLPPPPTEDAAIHIRFPEPRRSGKVVFELSSFSKTYHSDEGDVHVFDKAPPLVIERGHKIALIGKNGAGKSTLARIVNGTESFEGTRTLGHQVELAFFAQHQAEALNPSKTILDTMLETARGQTETEVRTILGAFLFSGDDVFKPVSVLSGGEKSRVALAKTLLVPANFLILDEPTNHLDIQSVNVLIEALQQYSGSFLVVSHDRHFLDQITNHVWRAEDHTVHAFSGNYSDYLWQIEHGTAARMSGATTGTSSGAASEISRETQSTSSKPDAEKKHSGKKTREQRRLEAEERARMREQNAASGGELEALSSYQLQKLYSKVEQKIFQAEREQRKIEKELADEKLYSDHELARTVTQRYEESKSELADLYRQWEEIAETLEAAGKT